MDLQLMQSLLDYDPDTGIIKVKKSSRVVNPQPDGFVCVFDGENKKRIRLKLSSLCYALGTGKIPQQGYKIVHKDQNESNFCLNNLLLLSSEQYKILKEAKRNISGGIRIIQHKVDMYSYQVKWFQDSVEKVKTFGDVIPARVFERRLKLLYSKIITRFCFGIE